MRTEDYILISDREKGMASAVPKVFPIALHAHCCQHIADNIQQRFGNKCRPLFWRIARAKKPKDFKSAIEILKKESLTAYLYLKAIDRKA